MFKTQIAKFNSYEQTEITCDTNQIIWIGNVPFTESYNLFKPLLVLLRQKKAVQEEDVRGVTIDKRNIRETLEAAIYNIAVRVAAYAQVAKNQSLKKFMTTSPSKLIKLTDAKFTTYAGDIYLKTEDVLANLVAYEVTQDTLDDLSDKTDAWLAIKDRPELAYDIKEKATQAIVEIMENIDDVLINRLDLNVMMFQAEHPDFVALYKESRTIDDLPTTKIALKGKITDADTTLPIPGVDVHLVEVDIHVFTTQNGTFQRKNLPDGPVNMVCTYPGYNPGNAEAMIFPGQTARVDILMERM